MKNFFNPYSTALCFLLFFVTFFSMTTSYAENSTSTNYQTVVEQIQQLGDQLVTHYTPQDALTAMDGFSKLYFDHYEASGMELAVAAISPTINAKTESYFTQLIGSASNNVSQAALQQHWQALRLQLNADLNLLNNHTGNYFANAFTQAFSILLREGFEALLIVTALLTYLRRSDHQQKIKYIYRGVGLAVVASGITAYLFATIFKNLGSHREAIEGITMLFASAVMFYVSYWLFAKRESAKWQSFIKSKVNQALMSSSATALGLAAFLAVYREGAETILFYQALFINQQGQWLGILSGFISACFALFLLYFAMQRASFKIPYRLFFTCTSLFLYGMSFSFIGGGILELQQAGWINITPIHGLPPLPLLGIFPAWENMGAQLIFLIPTLSLLAWYTYRQKRVSRHEHRA